MKKPSKASLLLSSTLKAASKRADSSGGAVATPAVDLAGLASGPLIGDFKVESGAGSNFSFLMDALGSRDVARRAGTYKVIDVALIDGDPTQPRKTFDGIEDLSKTIEASGLLQLPVVRKHPTIEGRFMIVVGERRTRAIRMLGWETMEVSLVDWDPLRVKAAQVIENSDFARKGVKAWEEASALTELVQMMGTPKKVIEATGMSAAVVYKRLAMFDLPPEIRELITKGLVTDSEVAGDLLRVLKRAPSVFSDLVAEGRAKGAIDRKMTRTAIRSLDNSAPKATVDEISKAIASAAGALAVSVQGAGQQFKVEIDFKDEEALRSFYSKLSR